jgi:hypothetical protein
VSECESDKSSSSTRPLHFIVMGGARECVSRWVLSLSGNVLHYESKSNMESAVSYLTTDIEGVSVVTVERRSVVVRDEELNVVCVLRLSKEVPVWGELVYSNEDTTHTHATHTHSTPRRRPHYFICCFESGLVAVSAVDDRSDCNAL